MARLGDGSVTTFRSPEEVRLSLAMIGGYASEMGRELKPDFRSPSTIISTSMKTAMGRSPIQAVSRQLLLGRLSARTCFPALGGGGSPTQCIESLQEYIDAGAAADDLVRVPDTIRNANSGA